MEKNAVVIDVAVHKDSNIRDKEYEKLEKCQMPRGRTVDLFFPKICQCNKLCVGT